MKIPLATDLKTRVGDTSKDARLKNAYVEIRGEQSVVRHRPSARGGVAVGTGTAQGGIGFNISGTDYFIGFWGDTLTPYTGGGTSWAVGTAYSIGDHVSYEFDDYWALTDHTGSQPPSANWSDSYVPPVPAPPPTYATWNPSDKTFNATLSNGGKTVLLSTSTSPSAGIRSTIGKSSGKWYWELTLSTGTYSASADNIFSAVATLDDPIGYPFGDYPNGWSYVAGADLISIPCPCKYNNTTPASYGTSYTIGDIIGCALDMTAGTIKFYKNGVDQGIAYSGLTGTVYAGMSFISTGSRTLTVIANFGASAFTYSVPSGFNSGLYT